MSNQNDAHQNGFFSKAKSMMTRLKVGKYNLKTVAAIILSVAIVAGSVVSVTAMSKTARITDGESVVSVLTLNGDTNSILQTAGIIYDSNDLIVSNKTSNNSIDITVYRAFDVNLIVNGVESVEAFNRGTVSDAIDMLGIKVDENDIIKPALQTELKADMTIEITHINNISLKTNGKTKKVVAQGETVAEALKFLNIEVDSDDIVTPELDSRLSDGVTVTVQKVEYKKEIDVEEIPFETVVTSSENVYIGDVSISQLGKVGEKEITKLVKYVDGKAVETQILKEEVVKEPKTQVELKGTKKKELSAGAIIQADGTLIDHNGKKVSYTQLMNGTCTAYTATGNLTSTGKVAQVGRVAVNPNIIPYGTKLYIVSADGKWVYGYAEAADTGGALMNGTVLVDLYYDTEYECLQFGRRPMNVYILG